MKWLRFDLNRLILNNSLFQGSEVDYLVMLLEIVESLHQSMKCEIWKAHCVPYKERRSAVHKGSVCIAD